MAKKTGSKSARTRKPSLREQAEDMAKQGKIGALVRELASGWSAMLFGADNKAQLLRTAIQQNADQGLLAMSDAIFLAIVGFDTEFLMRTQMGILERIEQIDHLNGARTCAAPPPALKADMERLMQVEDHLLEMLSRYATIRHTLALSEPKPEVAARSNVQTNDRARSEKIIPIGYAATVHGGGA